MKDYEELKLTTEGNHENIPNDAAWCLYDGGWRKEDWKLFKKTETTKDPEEEFKWYLDPDNEYWDKREYEEALEMCENIVKEREQ